jgi:hypothetical protein
MSEVFRALLEEVASCRPAVSSAGCATHDDRCQCDEADCVPTSKVMSFGVKPELMERIRSAVGTSAELKVTKYIGLLPHDCPGGVGCAFPNLEHLPAEPKSTRSVKP